MKDIKPRVEIVITSDGWTWTMYGDEVRSGSVKYDNKGKIITSSVESDVFPPEVAQAIYDEGWDLLARIRRALDVNSFKTFLLNHGVFPGCLALDLGAYSNLIRECQELFGSNCASFLDGFFMLEEKPIHPVSVSNYLFTPESWEAVEDYKKNI